MTRTSTYETIKSLYPAMPQDIIEQVVGALGDDPASIEAVLPYLEQLADIDDRQPLRIQKGHPCDVLIAPVESVDEVIVDVGNGKVRVLSLVLTRMECVRLGIALMRSAK